jgi:hypothetical protein
MPKIFIGMLVNDRITFCFFPKPGMYCVIGIVKY